MEKAEEQAGKETPVLVHTDLTVVDEDLRVLASSYRHTVNGNWQRTGPALGTCAEYSDWMHCYVQPCVGRSFTGRAFLFCSCTDWWLALTASAFGLIVPLDEATILYRQHGDNAVGAKFVRSPRYLLRRLFDVKGYRKELAETFLQSESFYDAFRDRLSPEQRALTAGYGSLSQAGWLRRRWFQLKNRTVKYGVVKKAAGFLFG